MHHNLPYAVLMHAKSPVLWRSAGDAVTPSQRRPASSTNIAAWKHQLHASSLTEGEHRCYVALGESGRGCAASRATGCKLGWYARGKQAGKQGSRHASRQAHAAAQAGALCWKQRAQPDPCCWCCVVTRYPQALVQLWLDGVSPGRAPLAAAALLQPQCQRKCPRSI
jgi:hypothetical protein